MLTRPVFRAVLVLLLLSVGAPALGGGLFGWGIARITGDPVVGGFIAGATPVGLANVALWRLLPYLRRTFRPTLEPAPAGVRIACSGIAWMGAVALFQHLPA